MQSDCDFSDVNDMTSSQWEECSAASEKENEKENEPDHEDVASIHSNDFTDEPANVNNTNNNTNLQPHSSVLDQSIDENEILLFDAPNVLPISTTLHNVDITAELERQRSEIQRLREELGLAHSQRDEALRRMEELREERDLERLRLAHLRQTNGSIAQQNITLRNMLSRQQQRQIARMQKKNESDETREQKLSET